jgi:hypothetical protein
MKHKPSIPGNHRFHSTEMIFSRELFDSPLTRSPAAEAKLAWPERSAGNAA